MANTSLEKAHEVTSRGWHCGRPIAMVPNHPRTSAKKKWLYEHILVVEKAMGKLLPTTAKVHHVDLDKTNNNPRNLVVCEDDSYHFLLHRRQRVLAYGGDPNTEAVCGWCQAAKPFSMFHMRKGGVHAGKAPDLCKECSKLRRRTYPSHGCLPKVTIQDVRNVL